MKNCILIIMVLAINVVLAKASNTYPFDVQKTGVGKKAVIFIPGFGCSGDVWTDTRLHLDKQFTCYTLTMAGFAGTAPQENATFDRWKQGVAQYIQDHNIDRPIVIGHSMGGALALALAADYPLLVGKIVVVDALPCLSALRDPNFKSNPSNDCSPWATQMGSTSDEQFSQMQKMSIPSLVQDQSKYDLIVGWTVKSDRKTFGNMYCDFLNTDLREKIKSITCPSLVLLESAFKPMATTMEDQYKGLATGNIKYADKGLHFIMFDDFDWYMNQINEFLK
ncbi:alpha/beta fold hydrolase [Pseudochryseolinea flava]|nr:alpha/beta hydrolase [Pseudochryseolinea flava]